MNIRALRTSPTAIAMLAMTLLAFAVRIFTLTRPGYLTGVTEYDDGVYLGGAIRLLHGALPYRDFAFVQPPGILLLMLPVALLTTVTTTTHALAAARLLTVLASVACVPLAGSLVRHRGTLVTLVTCAVMAVYPDDITTAHTLILEPWMNLLVLIGVCLAFRRGRVADGRRLLWAGICVGFAGSVKFWAGLPAAAVLLTCLLSGRPGENGRGGGRRALRYVIGLVIGFGVPVVPIAAFAPVRFTRSTLLDQMTRAGSYVPRSMRLAHITGLIDFLNGNGHFTLRAGTHSLFASGGAAATPGTSAGWLPYVTVLAAAALIAAGYWRRPGAPDPPEWLAIGTALVASAAIVAYSAFFYHYPDFAAPWIAIAAGGAFGVFGGFGTAGAAAPRRLSRAVTAVVAVAVVLLAAFEAREMDGLAAPDIYPNQAVIPAGACVVTDQVSVTISANRFTSARPGCPDIMDALAQTLVLSHGVSIQGGASRMPKVVAAWRATLGAADYVWLSRNNWRRIPWTRQLDDWFDANFTKLPARGGLGAVYKRSPR
jgi:hypothetical protein